MESTLTLELPTSTILHVTLEQFEAIHLGDTPKGTRSRSLLLTET